MMTSGRVDRYWPSFTIALATLATLAALAATVTTEVVMVPTSSERTRVIALLVGLGAVAVTLAVIMRLFSPRSFTRRMLLAAVSGPVVVAIMVSIGSQTMFLSNHDLEFLLILLAFSTVLGIGVVHSLAKPLMADLAALTDVARRVGAGDLDVRSDLRRMDEIGELSSAIDMMIEEIRQARTQRDEAERERSITLASLSHDARTPLTSMHLAVEALIDGVATDPDRYLRSISSDITAVETLIADLFSIGQMEAGRFHVDPRPVDLVETVHEAVDCLRLIAEERDISIVVDGPPSLSTLGDEAQLGRVLSNVVGNAIRYAPDGDTVKLEICAEKSQLSVRDGGPGFPANFVEEAFQPFRRHDEARERATGGAGLGLAVARGIVEALNGRIWAEPGPGGTVHLTLPKVSASADG